MKTDSENRHHELQARSFIFGACSSRAWDCMDVCARKRHKEIFIVNLCKPFWLLYIDGCIWYPFGSSVFYEQQRSVGRPWHSSRISLPRTAHQRSGCFQGTNDDEWSIDWLLVKTWNANLLTDAGVSKSSHRFISIYHQRDHRSAHSLHGHTTT